MWKKLTACADTLPNDFEIVSSFRRGLPLSRGPYAQVRVPTLLIAGSKSPSHMQGAPTAIAAQIPDAETALLQGQTHEVDATVLAPVLARFFTDGEHAAAEPPTA